MGWDCRVLSSVLVGSYFYVEPGCADRIVMLAVEGNEFSGLRLELRRRDGPKQNVLCIQEIAM